MLDRGPDRQSDIAGDGFVYGLARAACGFDLFAGIVSVVLDDDHVAEGFDELEAFSVLAERDAKLIAEERELRVLDHHAALELRNARGVVECRLLLGGDLGLGVFRTVLSQALDTKGILRFPWARRPDRDSWSVFRLAAQRRRGQAENGETKVV